MLYNFGMQDDNDPLHHVQSGKIFDISFNPAADYPAMELILKPLYEANEGAISPFSLNGYTLVNPSTITDLFISLNQSLMEQRKAGKFSAKISE